MSGPLRTLYRRFPFLRVRQRRSVPLLDAIAVMGEQLLGIGSGDVFAGFRCTELDSIATVLILGGHAEAAAFVIARHAENDESVSGDDHAYLRILIDQHHRTSSVVHAAAERYAASLTAAH